MQVDIVNTFERKINPKCLPKHREVGFLGCRVASKAQQVGILELQERCLSQEGATEGKQGKERNLRTVTEDLAAEGDDRILNDIFDRTSVRTSVMFRLSV